MVLRKPIFSVFFSNYFTGKAIYEDFRLSSYSKNDIIVFLKWRNCVSKILYVV